MLPNEGRTLCLPPCELVFSLSFDFSDAFSWELRKTRDGEEAAEQREHRKLFCLLAEVHGPVITAETRHRTQSKDYNFQKSEFITVKL